MKVDLLIAEIGSTTTLVNAFDNIGSANPDFIGQGLAPTSVLNGDVTIGVNQAISDLETKLGIDKLNWEEFMATSSAAGGLKMTVHGLVKDMTVKAAEEAALGAGAVIKMVTAGNLREFQLGKIKDISPNIVLLAGGVDYGEEDVIINNAKKLSTLDIDVPFIYAGNKVLQEEVKSIFNKKGKNIIIAENVYPKIDTLNIEETRSIIHDVFAKHIVRAPGMSKIKEMLSIDMMPTPGAVMKASQLLKEGIGNLVTIDIGGATTDVHSVTEDSLNVREILMNPEPMAKRTVEGDLGVYLNASHVYDMLSDKVGLERIDDLPPIPRNEKEEKYIYELAKKAAITALERHAGKYRDLYGASGRQTVAEGKDLTAVNWIIGTGGALTRLEKGKYILGYLKDFNKTLLLPPKSAKSLIDNDYIMASMGLMSNKYPKAALALLKKSLKFNQ
jgi:uncharacterized protein (TIGR01319 family)